MTSFSIKRSAPIVVAFVITSLVPLATRAQSTELPPARTYHTDQYGQQTKVVKERWRDNVNGEKQGVYLLYNSKGLPITKYTYTSGVKNGPAFIIRDDEFYSISFRLTRKFIGSFLNNKEEGWWDVYNVALNGELGSLDRRMKYVAGNLEFVTTYSNGAMTAIYKYANGRKNGLARVYGATKEEYATGEYNNGVLVGTWSNAGLEANKIIYRKNGKLVFENGELSTIISPDGKVRSLVAEKAQKEVELQRTAVNQKAAAQAIALDIRLSALNPVNLVFPTDSYTLDAWNTRSLDTLAKALNMRRNNSVYRVKDLYIAVHSRAPRDASEYSRKMLYMLSVNRAYVIKQYLFSRIEDKDINIEIYPCGIELNDTDFRDDDLDERYQAEIRAKRPMPRAKEVYSQISAKYGVKNGNELIASTMLQANILEIVRAYFNSGIMRADMVRKADGEGNNTEHLEKIPSELWLTDIKGVLPSNYAQIENTALFRSRVEALFMEMNKKYGTVLMPTVLFTDDLLRRVK